MQSRQWLDLTIAVGLRLDERTSMRSCVVLALVQIVADSQNLTHEMASMDAAKREIRADYDAQTVKVYQAYPDAIADAAIAAQTLVPPFKQDRMTWIKPSFLWMAYRCGWASKPDQTRVLSLRITRLGFDEALGMGCLSHFDPTAHKNPAAWRSRLEASPVRLQWDPERDLYHRPLKHRSLQIGLSGVTVRLYVREWIVSIQDETALYKRVGSLVNGGRPSEATLLLPTERTYPVPEDLRSRLGLTP